MSEEGDYRGRRWFLRALAQGLGVFAGAGSANALLPPKPGIKLEKSAVSYRDSPNFGQVCAECRYWLGDKRCERVKGEISPSGWCMVFVKETP